MSQNVFDHVFNHVVFDLRKTVSRPLARMGALCGLGPTWHSKTASSITLAFEIWRLEGVK